MSLVQGNSIPAVQRPWHEQGNNIWFCLLLRDLFYSFDCLNAMLAGSAPPSTGRGAGALQTCAVVALVGPEWKTFKAPKCPFCCFAPVLKSASPFTSVAVDKYTAIQTQESRSPTMCYGCFLEAAGPIHPSKLCAHESFFSWISAQKVQRAQFYPTHPTSGTISSQERTMGCRLSQQQTPKKVFGGLYLNAPACSTPPPLVYGETISHFDQLLL